MTGNTSPPFRLACSWLAVVSFVAYVSPVDTHAGIAAGQDGGVAVSLTYSV